MSKKMLIALAAVMALGAFAFAGVASADYMGNDATWYSDGVQCPSGGSESNPCDTVVVNGTLTLHAPSTATVTCNASGTGEVWNYDATNTGTGADELDTLAFSSCSSNTGCAVTQAQATNLPWSTIASEDGNGALWDEIDGINLSTDLEPVAAGCPGAFTNSGHLNGHVTYTALPPSTSDAVTCPNDPAKTGVEITFDSASGTLSGSLFSATVTGSVVMCADNETALSLVGSF